MSSQGPESVNPNLDEFGVDPNRVRNALEAILPVPELTDEQAATFGKELSETAAQAE